MAVLSPDAMVSETTEIYEAASEIILSNHGQLPYTRRVRLNTLLLRAGYDIEENNKVTDWRMFVYYTELSAADIES